MKTRCLLAVAALISLSSCDEGRIYDDTDVVEERGVRVSMTGRLSGLDTWPDGYTVVLAAFDGKSDYAIVAKPVGTVPEGGDVSMEMEVTGGEPAAVELCAVNRLRRRVATFASVPCNAFMNGVELDAGDVDVSMFSAIQHDVFNTTCANCHGASTHAAAGLYLTEGHSYSSLVGVGSQLLPDAQRVALGDADVSVLYNAIATDLSAGWRYDHTKEIISTITIDLIKDWIDNGAQQ